MKKQQKFLHVVSVMVAIFALLLFYILGGGTANYVDGNKEQNNGINLTVPQAVTQELSTTRLEALERASVLDDDNDRMQRKQQASSFEWIPSSSDTLSSISLPTLTASSVEDVALQRGGVTITPHQEKQQFIAEKYQELAKRYGIDVSEGTNETTLNEQEEASNVKVVRESNIGFYGLSTCQDMPTDIQAVVHGEHRNLERGAIVKLRLLDDVMINKTRIPANTFLYGQLSFRERRAIIRIDNILYKQVVFPFAGSIYDKDGFEGLYVPDNRIDDATRKAGAQALANADLRIPSVSIFGSAANAVVGAFQSVAQQSISEQKINISSNYLVTIKQIVK
jgi:hypothetical protein